jgi:hypothetical protein
MKPLKLKWRKGPDGIRRADTNIGASLFIVQEGLKYVLQVNNSVPLFKSKSLSKCKAFAAKFREASPVGHIFKSRIWYSVKGCLSHSPKYRCLVCETDGIPITHGLISPNFPYETKHEQSLRKEFSVPIDHPVTNLLLKRAGIYGYHPRELETWKLEKKADEVQGEVYKGPVQELRIPPEKAGIVYAMNMHPGTIWPKTKLTDIKWKTIRVWAKAFIKMAADPKSGYVQHMTIGAIRNVLRTQKFKRKKLEKALKRLDLIFAADVEREKMQGELQIRARIKWHSEEEKRKLEEKRVKALPVIVNSPDKPKKKKKKGVLSKKERRRLAKEQKRLIDEYMEKKRLKKLKIKKQSKETRKR